jgi:hypothetical protein
MEISVKRISKYKDVEVTLDNTRVALGLMDEEEAMKLARTLKVAIQDLIDDRDECKAFLENDD